MAVDLNLLMAFEALVEEASVTGAAARLHVSQPAMSRTLARIREATGDPILVRTGRRMVPSARARTLREEVGSVVRRGRSLLSPEGELDPSGLERTFSIRCHDVLLPRLAPALVTKLMEEAPRVVIRFLSEGVSDSEDLSGERVDLEIGSGRGGDAGSRNEEIARDSLVVALRRNHPAARRPLTAERFASALHVVVSRRGRLRDPLDEALKTLRLKRRVVASAPTSAAALSLVRDCGLVTTVAARACGPMARSMGLILRPLPFPPVTAPVIQSWPAHLDHDRAHQWLRQLTRSLLQEPTRA